MDSTREEKIEKQGKAGEKIWRGFHTRMMS